MNRTKDFSSEIESISTSVDSDVGNLMKLIRKEAAVVSKATERAEASTPKQEEKHPQSESVPQEKETQSRRSRPQPKATLSDDIILETVTTRLRLETNELLTEVALRQRLKKCAPASRQDIIEAALKDWFRSQGYSK
jgi:hypothetical protein